MVLLLNELTICQQALLLDVAEQRVRSGLTNGVYCDPHIDWYPAELQNIQACFASLRSGAQLLGSVGTTDPLHPLIVDAARNAFEVASLVALRQPVAEFPNHELQLELAVLSPLQFIAESTLEGIASCIQAGDGVHVRCLDCAATFLPVMWERFADSAEFLQQLWYRAGLDPQESSAEVQVAKFTTQCFSRTLENRWYQSRLR